MSLGPWFYVLLIGIGGLHLAVALFVLRYESNRTIEARTTDEEGNTTTTADHVTCHHCDTNNEPGYRYCRTCVSELPEIPSAEQAVPTPLGREQF